MGKNLRIAIVGPESTGKTTLTEALAQHYRCAYTKEYARYFLEEHGPHYVRADLLRIAQGQLMVEAGSQELAEQHGGGLVLCDTDMITIRIWSEEKYGACDPLILQLARATHYDHWLLCAPDMPWEADPLRENPHDRDRLFGIYERTLQELGKPYHVVKGSRELRERNAVQLIDALR